MGILSSGITYLTILLVGDKIGLEIGRSGFLTSPFSWWERKLARKLVLRGEPSYDCPCWRRKWLGNMASEVSYVASYTVICATVGVRAGVALITLPLGIGGYRP